MNKHNDTHQSTPATTAPKVLTPNGNRAFGWYALSLLIISIDQVSKLYFENRLELHESISVFEPFLNWTLAFILGGSVGNLIDRFLYGHVIDFIHVHYANVWHYPVFNLADCGIVIGVALMLIDMLFLENKRHNI